MKKPLHRCSRRLTGLNRDWLQCVTLSATGLTEADIRLFTTLVRFDSIYYGHFKCNLRRLVDYPNLWAYTRESISITLSDTITRAIAQ
jgi:putative glutathione S-transferase